MGRSRGPTTRRFRAEARRRLVRRRCLDQVRAGEITWMKLTRQLRRPLGIWNQMLILIRLNSEVW